MCYIVDKFAYIRAYYRAGVHRKYYSQKEYSYTRRDNYGFGFFIGFYGNSSLS